MKFQDIKPFTKSADYSVSVSWKYLEQWLAQEKEYLGEDLFKMDPDFQRAHVWTESQQRAYVEFILRGGPGSREIKWNSAGFQKGHKTEMVLVDGKQRLEAVRKFLRDELTVFNNYKLSDFDGSLRELKCDFTMQVNDLETRAEVLQWYLDINAGGVAHTEDEILKVRILLEEEVTK